MSGRRQSTPFEFLLGVLSAVVGHFVYDKLNAVKDKRSICIAFIELTAAGLILLEEKGAVFTTIQWFANQEAIYHYGLVNVLANYGFLVGIGVLGALMIGFLSFDAVHQLDKRHALRWDLSRNNELY